MGNVSVLSICSLTAWHCDKESFLSLDDFNVVNDKLIIDGNGNYCLHLSIFRYFTHPNICNIHKYPFPVSTFLATVQISISSFITDNDLNFVSTAVIRFGSDVVATFYDAIFNVRIVTYVNVVKNYRISDNTVLTYVNLFEDY